MRISDIVQPKKGIQSPPAEKSKELKETLPASEIVLSPAKQPRQKKSKIFPEGYVKEIKKKPAPKPVSEQLSLSISSKKSAREIYSDTIELSRNFWKGLTQNPAQLPSIDSILRVIEEIIDGLEHSSSHILSFIERSTPEDYLAAHIANVTILSLAVSETLKWPKDARKNMGLGAFLHDTGLVFHQPVYSKMKELSKEERDAIQSFPLKSIEVLNPILNSFPLADRNTVQNILLQTQERIHGGGYPYGLKGNEISREAQVVRLCDIYESITHPRAFRGRKIPHETLRDLIELSGESFDGQLVKALWQTLTLFPPGTYVELSSGEMARVIEINKQNPTHPLVKVIISSQKKRALEERIMDLSKTKDVTIKRAVNECALILSDKKLQIELTLLKWWFK